MIEVPMENFVNEFNMWMQTVQSELQEKSMRSTIIICAATLDAQLEKLIKNILLQEKNTDGDIFEGGNAILSTFSSKITLAYYLGLISEHERLWIAFEKLEIKQHMKLVFCLGAYQIP